MDDRIKVWATLKKHDPAEYLRDLILALARGVRAGWANDPDKRLAGTATKSTARCAMPACFASGWDRSAGST